MLLDEEREEELHELVERLDRLVPADGCHLTLPAGESGRGAIGNRAGYLRFAVEILKAALHPLPESETHPPRIEPAMTSLLTEDSAPWLACELDESIVGRPPAESRLGALGQMGSGVALVIALILALIGASVVWRWVFG